MGGTLFQVTQPLLVRPVRGQWGPWGSSRLGWKAGDEVAHGGHCLWRPEDKTQARLRWAPRRGLTMLRVALSHGLRLRYFRCRS